MKSAVVLLNRDLRVHDHPALAEAHRVAETVVPLFVLDDSILGGRFASPNRTAFLLQSLSQLRHALRHRGGDLVLRMGDTVTEAVAIARQVEAGAIFTSADVSAHAVARQARLGRACEDNRLDFAAFPGVTVVPPLALRPSAADHYRVFGPYWRAWRQAAWRQAVPSPRHLRLPDGVHPGRLPALTELTTARPSPSLASGGEAAGRGRLRAWQSCCLAAYGSRRNDLAEDATSRLSPYLHFGCLSPLEVARVGAGHLHPGAEDFMRQLCWRDFLHQVTAAFPAIATVDYRAPRADWRDDPESAEAWRAACTGWPIVDAGLRQLMQEGWMHNRARLVVASFLTRNLRLDWRIGAAHFLAWLVDGDIANNSGNWQWVAGTGNNTRPNVVLNPLRQAARFDPKGDYVRRYVPELADIEGPAVHQVWKLPAARRVDYPRPIVQPRDDRGSLSRD